jgi:hypothetical protein
MKKKYRYDIIKNGYNQYWWRRFFIHPDVIKEDWLETSLIFYSLDEVKSSLEKKINTDKEAFIKGKQEKVYNEVVEIEE